MHLLLMLFGLALQPYPLLADDTPGRTPLPKRPTPAVTLFVATNGDDANPGTREQPFATLDRARNEIRKLKQSGPLPKGGIAVEVAGGCYKVSKTFTLAAEDSGTEEAPIVYQAGEGDMPTFTGGLRLRDFKPVRDTAILKRLPEESRGKVMQVDLAAHGLENIKPLILGGFSSGRGFRTYPTMELFFDGRALPLARWPNDGFVHITDVQLDGHKIHGRTGTKTGRFTYSGDRPNRWKDDKDAMLYGYWFFGWADSYEPVESIDTKRREITLKRPYHKYGYRKGQPYYALNLLSEIDRPGEWYLDRDTAVLYLYPPSDPNKAVIKLSTVDCPFVVMNDVSHVSFERFVWEFGCGDGVLISGGDHCLLAGCTIRHCGGDAVTIRGGSNHGLLSCDIHSMGRGGVQVDGGNRKTLAPGGHFVENCHIHNLSRIDHTYTPAVRMGGVGNRIAHNRFHNIRSSAIRLGGNDHLVEFNDVFDVVWESDDQGGADMFGNATFRGNIYRYNYWHHIGIGHDSREEPACGRAGIRLDDAISGTLVFGNVFWRCSAGKLGFGGVQIHGGKDNVLENNIFVDCEAAISFSAWGEGRWKQFTKNALQAPDVDKSLYVQRYPQLARLSEDHDINTVAHNLVYRCNEFLRRDRGRNRLIGNIVVDKDPGFIDAAGGDFRLKGKLPPHFKPIPFEQIGLYTDSFRHKLPGKHDQ